MSKTTHHETIDTTIPHPARVETTAIWGAEALALARETGSKLFVSDGRPCRLLTPAAAERAMLSGARVSMVIACSIA